MGYRLKELIVKQYGNSGNYIKNTKFQDCVINSRVISFRLFGILIRRYGKLFYN